MRLIKSLVMRNLISISFDSNRGDCAIIGIAQVEDVAKSGEIQFDQACG